MLTITKAALTATAENKTKVYGEANPELTVAYTGFVNDDTTEDLDEVLLASTEATISSNAGTYAITLSSVSDNNYEVTSVAGELLVNKALLTVGVNNVERKQGEENPAFTLTFSGFVNGDDESVIDELPTAACDAEVNSDVADYDIVLSGGVDNNYEFTFINGILTVSQKVGVNRNKLSESKLYPNPANTHVNINLPNLDSEVEMIIYNSVGTLVKKVLLTQVNSKINISELENGMYIVRLQTPSKYLVL